MIKQYAQDHMIKGYCALLAVRRTILYLFYFMLLCVVTEHNYVSTFPPLNIPPCFWFESKQEAIFPQRMIKLLIQQITCTRVN